MKKYWCLLVICLTGIIALSGCKSTPKVKDVSGTVEVVEHKGTAWGVAQPDWFDTALQTRDQEKLKKAFGIKDKYIWVVTGKGKNLDFLQNWVDQNARVQIAASIEQGVIEFLEAETQGDSDDVENAFVRDTSSAVMEAIAGLNKETDWWARIRTRLDKKSDYTEQYTYMVVYSLDEKLYAKQMQEAFNNKADKETTMKLIQYLKDYYELIDLGEK